MEQGNSITDKEREVCEILLNLPYLIKKSESYDKVIVWGVRGKRSAIDLPPSPPHHRQPEKKPRIVSEGLSPVGHLSLPSIESDDKAQQCCEEVHKTKWREELGETIDESVQTRESLTRKLDQSLEKVKSYLNKLKAYNKALKAKQQEWREELRKTIDELVQTRESLTRLQLRERGRKNIHNLGNQTPSLSSPLPLPNLVSADKVNYVRPPGTLDLKIPADQVVDVEYLQTLDGNRQAPGDNNRARAEEKDR